jgi:rubrerythrin
LRVLDEARRLETRDGDYVEFMTTGAPAHGAFHCAECGYGVTVNTALPRCPMCGGTTWEAAAAPAFGGRRQLQ